MRKALFASTLLLLAPLAASADEAKGHVMRGSDLAWGPTPAVMPKGGQMAVLAGDPAKEGPFIVRLKAPAGYKVPAHNHPTGEFITVVSGTFAVGMGDKLDETKTDKLKAGDSVNLPAGMNHFAIISEESVVQISSIGPFKITYVNPADDPSLTQ